MSGRSALREVKSVSGTSMCLTARSSGKLAAYRVWIQRNKHRSCKLGWHGQVLGGTHGLFYEYLICTAIRVALVGAIQFPSTRPPPTGVPDSVARLILESGKGLP